METATPNNRRQIPIEDLETGLERYEALRKLNPREFADLHRRNLKGENFDRLVDELVRASKDKKKLPPDQE